MIQLVVAWTCVGVFIATAALTLLALARVIRLAEKKYLDRLFKVLVVEIVVVGVGVFAGFVERPATVAERCETKGREDAIDTLKPEIRRLETLALEKQAIIDRHLARIPVTDDEKATLRKPVKLDDAALRSALSRRVAVRPP
jgi:hypothetical protein